MTPSPQPTSQAARTARRAEFRDSFSRPHENRSPAEHAAAIEAFAAQLLQLRRPPRERA